ncbi:catalase [Bacteriovorax sp. BSW11_IV]|uniref:catalase n=1 Tax=Bacteriovorax sp. BSW11_IV TaxID=1353529 RepID=UPI00038A3317|nr:catalase [Bacteriovorax sp. BSW11_IV]EQC48778.1 catalase [Bacteriovorax sp. BSW11_IV]
MKKLMTYSMLLTFCALTTSASYLYNIAYDFPLYKGEQYEGGSKTAELRSYYEVATKVLNVQKILQKDQIDGRATRVFHAKQHACLTGKLTILPHRPNDSGRKTYEGMFKEPKEYDVLARFSNGVGFSQHDKKPDVRGLALKVFDVYDQNDGIEKNVDLLMTNSPTPAASNLLGFANFMEAVVKYGVNLGTVKYSLANPRAGKSLLSAVGIKNYKVRSLATQRYWSGHPYLLGENNAMKFSVIPLQNDEPSLTKVRRLGENYLSEELLERTKNSKIRFILAVQLEKNSQETPIEDNLNEWTEKESPSINVAVLSFDQQDFSSEKYRDACNTLSFTPANYISDHRPLSNMGRGRIFAYKASQIGRGAKAEPNKEIVEQLRD